MLPCLRWPVVFYGCLYECQTTKCQQALVLEKCNMRRVGTIVGNRKIRGGIYDSYRNEIYSD